jgi:DNA-directed RNA polymerase
MNEFVCDTTEALRLEIWQLENEANIKREAEERARQEQEQLILDGKLSESISVANVITKAAVEVTKALKEYIEQTLAPSRGRPSNSIPACKVLSMLDDMTLHNVSADCIAMCLDGVGQIDDNSLVHQFGEHIEHEFMLRAYRDQDRKAAKYLKENLEKQAGNTQQRYKQVTYSLSANRLHWEQWPEEKQVLLGQIMYQVILDHSGLFDIQTVVDSF